MSAVVWSVPATVLRVIDGDTVELQLDLGWRITLTAPCRVAGVDTPELPTAEGKAAKAFTAAMLPVGCAVRFVSEQLDKYGRPLGQILLPDGRSLGLALLAAGHAKTLTYH
jgi:micrococcal nuclease